MIQFTQGNLLESDAEALVNTVNTVGVMGKGIALMFKEQFPENFRIYAAACEAHAFDVGEMLVTRGTRLGGPQWIINFPTKKHWRHPSKLIWIADGLRDLKAVLTEKGISSVALPPLGSGNGGLPWEDVKHLIVSSLGDLDRVHVTVYEPTSKYQNVAKTTGVERLTPARALVAELVRRYSILGIECSLLEIHKLVYLLERMLQTLGSATLDFRFEAYRYGPYAPRLSHLLNSLDGSYLHSEKRLSDASPSDPIRFDDTKKIMIASYLKTDEMRMYRIALDRTTALIDGFESPLGMELLATVDWLVAKESATFSIEGVTAALRKWPGGEGAAQRKLGLFDARMIALALEQLEAEALSPE